MRGDIGIPYVSNEPQTLGDWFGLLIADLATVGLVLGSAWLLVQVQA